jgi:hypothetical protein
MNPRSLLLATLLSTAALANPPAGAAPVAVAERAACADRVHTAALRARAAHPDLAAAVDDARAIPRRDGTARLIGAPTNPEVGAIWLDLALNGAGDPALLAARASLGAEAAPLDLVVDAFRAADEPRVRAAIVGRLRGAHPDVIDRLLGPASRDADPEVRAVATSTLVRRSDAGDHLALIRRAAADGSPQVRAQAAFGLGVVGARSDAELVQGLLADPDPDVRLKALRALERLDPSAARAAAPALHNDPDPSVARAARGL